MKRTLKSELTKKAKDLGISEDEAMARAVAYWLESFNTSKGVTLADVARVAGVSLMTCSYALNRESGKVADETRLKVRRTAEKLGYVKSQKSIALVYSVASRMAATHYNILEVASILEKTPLVVTGMIKRKELPAEKVGRAWWIPKGAIA